MAHLAVLAVFLVLPCLVLGGNGRKLDVEGVGNFGGADGPLAGLFENVQALLKEATLQAKMKRESEEKRKREEAANSTLIADPAGEKIGEEKPLGKKHKQEPMHPSTAVEKHAEEEQPEKLPKAVDRSARRREAAGVSDADDTSSSAAVTADDTDTVVEAGTGTGTVAEDISPTATTTPDVTMSFGGRAASNSMTLFIFITVLNFIF